MAYFQKNNNEDKQNQDVSSGNVGGNTYSTSSSEVSSTVESNNENNKKSDTGSGNFVNLNKYLDANQGKTEGYANTFVQDDLNKGKDYQGNIQNAQDRYLSSIKSDNAYTYNSVDNKILNDYLKNSSSVKNADKQRAMNILKGYQGVSNWSNTGDQFDYNNLKKDSDNFNTLSGNIIDQDYLKTQMSNDLSSGGKSLDSFLLGASDNSRNVLNDASSQFSELASLLDSTSSNLDKERTNVVNKATQNQKAYDKLRQDKTKELENLLRTNYANSKAINDSARATENANPLGRNDPFSNEYLDRLNTAKQNGWIAGTETYKVRDDLSSQAAAQLNRELQELQNRSNSLTGNVALNGNSSLDDQFKFISDWRDPTEIEQQNQIKRANNFFYNIAAPRYTYGDDPTDIYGRTLKAYQLGLINDDQAKQNLAQIKR